MSGYCADQPLQHEVLETFGTWDYVTFSCMLSLSAIIGIYFAVVDRNKGSEEYLMGGGKVGPLPIAASLATTFFSAITVLGQPVEFYSFGTMNIYFLLTYLFCTVLVSEVFAPVYAKYEISSIYEYLEIRFSRSVRYMGTSMFILQSILYIAIVTYAPALALETVTGLDRWVAVWITGAVCVFYTSLGGLKAVVWTDTLQIVLMLAGFLSIIIEGWIVFGSFDKIFDAAERGGRLVWDDFRPDPRIRHSFWSIIFGSLFGVWGHFFCTSQSYVQRVLACRSRRDMRIAIYVGYIGIALILVFSFLTGLIMYAFYECCDPLSAGWVSTKDQLVPYLAVDIFRNQPGAASLFVIAAYGGTLSTFSSGINSMATVVVTDFIKPNEQKLQSLPFFAPTDKWYTIASKLLSLIFGIICICLTYVVSYVGDGILQAALSICGIFGGPNMAIFLMGMIFPFANKWGAHVGYVAGFAISVWVYVGSLLYPPGVEFTNSLPLSIESCSNPQNNTISPIPDDTRPSVAGLYEISYLYLGTIGFTVCLIVGLITSLLTGGLHQTSTPVKQEPNKYAKENGTTRL